MRAERVCNPYVDVGACWAGAAAGRRSAPSVRAPSADSAQWHAAAGPGTVSQGAGRRKSRR